MPPAPPRSRSGRQVIPLRSRKVDWILLAFFAVNLFFITYFVDIEQLTIANPFHFAYPAWPPHAIVDMVHSYGQKYDPLLMARPAFWRMTIWIDVLWNGPFYVAAIYAISRGREWIRVPALIWSGSMSAVVLIILAEEYNGVHASPHFPIVLLLNIPVARAAARHHRPDGPRPSVHQARRARSPGADRRGGLFNRRRVALPTGRRCPRLRGCRRCRNCSRCRRKLEGPHEDIEQAPSGRRAAT